MMADPVTILGAAGALIKLITLVYETIESLNTLHGRWNEADFTLLNLKSQLTALRAGLDKIQEWMNSDTFEPHHQLVMDLETSLSCCRMLITKLHAQFSDLSHNSKSHLDFSSRMRLLINGGTLEELQKMLDRQTTALTLLLTACNCKAISEQKALLEQRSSRRILQRVRDDSSSLYVQRDSSSICSHWTGTLSKISRTFDFDRELFISKVYERALRGSLKNTVELLRRQQPRGNLNQGSSASKESRRLQSAGSRLDQISRRSKREVTVLLLGEPDLGSTVVKHMQISQRGGYSKNELLQYKITIRKTVVGVLENLVMFAANLGSELDDETRAYIELLQIRQRACLNNKDAILTPTAAYAVQQLWQCDRLQSLFLESQGVNRRGASVYFIEGAVRIAHADYTPTESDILKTTSDCENPSEMRFSMGSLTILLYNNLEQRQEERKWIRSFESITSIVFCVDLSCYDQTSERDFNRNKMMKSITYFDSIVNSSLFRRTSVVLLLCNTVLFRQKLTHTPLSHTFPSYTGSSDFTQASKYIIELFNQHNTAGLSIYPYFTEASDRANLGHMFAAVKETILNNVLQDSSILKPPKTWSTPRNFQLDDEPPEYVESESATDEDGKAAATGDGLYTSTYL